MDMVSSPALGDSKRLVRDSVGSAIWVLKQGVRKLIYAVGYTIKNTVGNMQEEGRTDQGRIGAILDLAVGQRGFWYTPAEPVVLKHGE